MKNIITLLVLVLGLVSCKKEANQEASTDSLYQLDSKWENQNGMTMKMADLKGKNTVMVMIYTSCKTACPRLTAEMRDIYRGVGQKDDVQYVLVSIDPKNDTPETMKKYLEANQFSGNQWLFLRSSEEDTRELANVLAVKYKEISPMEFSHSNIITILDKSGNMLYQKEGLNVDVSETVKQISKLN